MTLRFNLHSVDSNHAVTREYSSIRDFINQNGHGEVGPDKNFVSSDGIQVLKPVTPEAMKLMQGLWEASLCDSNLVSPTRLDILRGLGLTVDPSERNEDPVSVVIDHMDYRMDPEGYLETPLGRTFIVHSRDAELTHFDELRAEWLPAAKDRVEGSIARKDVLVMADHLNGLLAITDTTGTATQLDELRNRKKFRAPVMGLDDYSDDLDPHWEDNGNMITINGDWATLKRVEANLKAAGVITSEPNIYATYQHDYSGFYNNPENPLPASLIGFLELSFPSHIGQVFLDRKSDDAVVSAYPLNEALLRELGAPGDTLYVLEDGVEEPSVSTYNKGDYLMITQDVVRGLDPREYRQTQNPGYANGNTPF